MSKPSAPKGKPPAKFAPPGSVERVCQILARTDDNDLIDIATTCSNRGVALAAEIALRKRYPSRCHNDGGKTNNTPSNLRWDTRPANFRDRKKHNEPVFFIAAKAPPVPMLHSKGSE